MKQPLKNIPKNIKDVFTKNHLHIQSSTFACGPSAILNVLRLKGDFSRTESELIKLCDAKRGPGSANQNVLKAAKQVGLKVIEEKEKGSIQDIERNLDGGAYVIALYWHAFNEDGHYTVITEYDDRAFYFVDSSLGFLRLWKKDFKEFWYNTDQTVRGWYLAVK